MSEGEKICTCGRRIKIPLLLKDIEHLIKEHGAKWEWRKTGEWNELIFLVPESAWRKQRREKRPRRTKPEIDPREPYFWPP